MTAKRPLVWGDDTQSLREIRDGETLVGIPGAGGGASLPSSAPTVMAGGVALKDGAVGAGDAVFLRVDDAGVLRCARASAASDGHPAEALAAQVAGDRVWFCQHGLVSGYGDLPPGETMFLSAEPGGIAATPPNTHGQYVQRIGTVISDGLLLFEPGAARLILEE